jgi:hypothetical protein
MIRRKLAASGIGNAAREGFTILTAVGRKYSLTK